jgi:hypothetical protein
MNAWIMNVRSRKRVCVVQPAASPALYAGWRFSYHADYLHVATSIRLLSCSDDFQHFSVTLVYVTLIRLNAHGSNPAER